MMSYFRYVSFTLIIKLFYKTLLEQEVCLNTRVKYHLTIRYQQPNGIRFRCLYIKNVMFKYVVGRLYECLSVHETMTQRNLISQQ